MAILPADAALIEIHLPVVVIGGGACGLVAALAVAESGLGVLVLERDRQPTGSTSLSAGLIPAAGTALQRAAGIDDTAERFAADLTAKAKGRNDPSVVAAVAAASGPTIDWLVASQGLALRLVEGFTYPGHSRLRMHGPASQQPAPTCRACCSPLGARAGVGILTEASVEDLYADETGRIVAVAARRPDGAREVVGCGAVVLACNGFGGNADAVRRLIPEMAGAEYCGHPSNTGDAIRPRGPCGVAWRGDRGPRRVPGARLGRGPARVAAHLGGHHPGRVPGQPGRRAVRERDARRSGACRNGSAPAFGVAWDVFDGRCERPALGFHDYRQIASLGAVKQADSVEALAAVTGLPLPALRRTFAQVSVLRGGYRDGSVRTRLHGDAAACAAIPGGQGDRRAVPHPGWPRDRAHARVLREDGRPFPNLVAGGGAARGLSGPSSWGYLSGNGLLSAVVLGRIAGTTAARLATAQSA